jgi:hypothetical protein
MKGRGTAPAARAATALAIAALIGATLLSCGAADKAVRVAIVYGISIYDVSQPEGYSWNLRYCDDDADSMAAIFERSGYQVLRRITGNTGAGTELPDKERMRLDIQGLPAAVDRLVIYYSGHGTRRSVAGGGMEDFIVPFGGIDSAGIHPEALVSASELHGWLAACPARQIVLIMDSCYSGGFVSDSGEIDLAPPVYGPLDDYGPVTDYGPFSLELAPPLLMRFMLPLGAPSGALVLSAAGSEEFSWESGGHGIFTSALMEGAGTGTGRAPADASGDGIVSALEAYAFAAAKVNRDWNLAYATDYSYETGQYVDFFPHISSGSLDLALFSAP